MLEQCDRYEFLRTLNPREIAQLNARCFTQGINFDDEVLRLAEVWCKEKRIDL